MSGLIQIPIFVADASAGAATEKFLSFLSDYKIIGAKLINNGAIAADGTNYARIKVLGNDKATIAFEWSTKDDAEGALSDEVAVSLADKKSGKEILTAGTALKFEVTKHGSGKQLDACVMLQLELARSYA